MGLALRSAITLSATWALILFLFASEARADDGLLAGTVQVKFASGTAELAPLSSGVRYFSNRRLLLGKIPAELEGLTYTHRPTGAACDVDIDIPADATVYLLVENDHGGTNLKGVKELNRSLSTSGWTRLADPEGKGTANPAIYRKTFSAAERDSFPTTGFSGVIVAAKNLALDSGTRGPDKKPDHPEPDATATPHVDGSADAAPIGGPATRVSSQQASIKSLEIYETDTGLMLGQTSEVVLTATRGDSPKLTAVRFVGKVGDQMGLARDEAQRFVRLSYPNWYVSNAEITFEDKYVAHDGGSIGAAVGTMILSVIEGFQIDPDVAITGDISANGKVRAIGGVSAKIRGATASKCTLAAVPVENLEQLVDTVTYSGPAAITDIQVIGISNLSEAIATVRIDRSAKLAQAISLFADVQKILKDKPADLKSRDTQDKLARVLELAPHHLSAQILLAVAQGKQPKTLSPAASRYYTSVAARSMLAVLTERAASTDAHQVSSSVVRAGLADLRKLRPLADVDVRPLIDAWARYIEAWNSIQQGIGSSRSLETQRQSLLDEMAKEQTDATLTQKMLKEGM